MRVLAFGFPISGPGFRFHVPGSGFRASGSGFQVPGSRFRVSGSQFLVPGFEFWVPDLGFRGSWPRLRSVEYSQVASLGLQCRRVSLLGVGCKHGAGEGDAYPRSFPRDGLVSSFRHSGSGSQLLTAECSQSKNNRFEKCEAVPKRAQMQGS